jgi:hypothetical protein
MGRDLWLVGLLVVLGVFLAWGTQAVEISIRAPEQVQPGEAFGVAVAACGAEEWAVWVRTKDASYVWIDRGPVESPAVAASVLPMSWSGTATAEIAAMAWAGEEGAAANAVIRFGPKPTPTPPAEGYVSGRAEILVTGCGRIPDSAHDKGVIWSLAGRNCETFRARHRNRCLDRTCQDAQGVWRCTTHPTACIENGAHRADWQLKGGYQQQWAETNYFSTTPCADGIWIIEWGVDRGRSWAQVIDGAGHEQWLEWDCTLAFSEIRTADFICPWITWSSQATAEVLDVQWGRPGRTSGCN